MYSSKTQNKTKEYVAPSIQQVTLFESKTKQTKKKVDSFGDNVDECHYGISNVIR